ncbi:hypothetical protein IPM65_05625 [Candidatus Roizmanbacteria bacterium]|nr:MAG: hypothetical protein IPM65_05625 [Candidatus Roizmanbacteria bacterium]
MEHVSLPHQDQILLLRYQILLMQLSVIPHQADNSFLMESAERDPTADAYDQMLNLRNQLTERGIMPDE